eukprot:1848077-Pyramimonas_sp.AAC.1
MALFLANPRDKDPEHGVGHTAENCETYQVTGGLFEVGLDKVGIGQPVVQRVVHHVLRHVRVLEFAKLLVSGHALHRKTAQHPVDARVFAHGAVFYDD